jgi:hypothetical protein
MVQENFYPFIQTFKKLDGVEVHPIFLHILMDFEGNQPIRVE